jgi:hypothetical protein
MLVLRKLDARVRGHERMGMRWWANHDRMVRLLVVPDAPQRGAVRC